MDDDNGVKKLAETGETVKLAKNVFLPFFCEVLFEKGSAGEVHGLPGATVKKLGLGSAETWHGGPTLRGSGCEVVNIKENLEQQRARCGDTPFLSISVMHGEALQITFTRNHCACRRNVPEQANGSFKSACNDLCSSITAGRHPSEKDTVPRTFSRPVVSLACLEGESS